ncbi:MAG TPA: BTAD domain-containing putative transcriptional regulator, partial [Candidatus Binatia bacterium]
EMRALMHARTVAPVIRVLASMTVVWSEFAHAQPSYRETVSSMLDLVQTHGLSEAAKHATLGCGIKAALSDGDLSTAQKWIDEMRKDLETLGPGYKGWYYASTMRMALLKDDVDEAAKQQSEMLRLSLASGATLACLDAHLISAEVFARRGRERKAQAHLGEAFEIVRNAGSPYFEFMARLTEAYLCLHRGQEAEGLNALGRAMELGRTGNYVNSFVWQPPVMAKLCAKALEAGIEVEYVRRLVRQRRLVPLEVPVELEAWPWPVKIFTLGRFEVMVDDQPLSGQRKVPLRLLTFLKALIALGAMEVPVTRLMDTLWPDTEDDTAKENLDKTLQRLRHLLGHEQILPVKGARVSLNPAICWTDAQAFERLAAKGAKDSDSASFGRAMELYRGPFLADEGDESWIDVTRERLRRKYHQTVFALVEAKERDGEPDRAIEYLRQAVGVDPLDEPIVCRLITLLVQNNRRTEALAVVQKYRKELAEFGVEASSRVDSLIQSPILNG